MENYKRLNSLFSVIFFFILSPSLSSAESIDNTALAILYHSPEFISQNYALESAARNLHTASNLPDPEVSGEYLWMPRDVDNRWSAQLSWSLDWPGVYAAKRKEAGLLFSAAEKNTWKQRIDRLAEIRDLLLDFIQCRQKLRLLDELALNNDSIYRLAEQAAKGGEITVLDLNKVRLEYANIKGAKAAIIDEEADILGNLSYIYGDDCLILLENLDCAFPPVKIPSPQEIDILKQNAPDVIAALADADAARQAKSVAKMEALPAISLGYKHAFEDAMHFNGVVWGISLPIFSSRGKQKAANAAILEAEYMAEAHAAQAEAEINAIVRKLALTSQQIEELAPVVENADYNAALLKAYKGGVITLIEYISDRNYFTNAAVELVTLRHAAAKTQSSLRRFTDFPAPNP